MRILPFVAIMLAFAVLASAPAGAQVSSSDESLNALKPANGAKKTPRAAVTSSRSSRKTVHTHTPSRPQVAPGKSAAALKVPAAPPAHPVIAPPPLVLPTHPPPPPPPVPVKPHAAGAATPLANGTQVTFGPGVADLNPDTLAAIKSIASEALADPAMIVGVTAWAPGTKDDPSTPRRLSLDRALAARAVLINAGIASERIRAVAKGMNDIGAGAADRVEITKILPVPTKP